MKPKRPSVWVPFEKLPKGGERKCDDLPRFERSADIRLYIRNHPELVNRLIEWREHFEKEYIDEFRAGVGTLKILLGG